MILQNIQYPEPGDSEKGMYYWTSDEKCHATGDKGRLAVGGGCTLHFNTYFNSFSYGKWKKYTRLAGLSLRLHLRGSFEVMLVRNDAAGEAFEQRTLSRTRVRSPEMAGHAFDYPETEPKGIVGFVLVALEDGEVAGGCYAADIDEGGLDEVNLALCICTYRREGYIDASMAMLEREVFAGGSMLSGHLRAYIADNGQTLGAGRFGAEEIRVCPNRNTGGSGGFSRAMIEAAADRERHRLTHMVLMDDDIVFTHHALERAYAFLRLLREEHRGIMLGGAMLRLDLPFAQFAAGETWGPEEIVFNKISYNLYELRYVLRNEIEEGINQLGWWFCCVPMDGGGGLALPLFYQYDDIEYSQRNAHRGKVTLNGVCVWHEAFEKKTGAAKGYYAMRNRLIVSSIHGGAGFTKRLAKRLVREAVARELMMYRYGAAELLVRAAEDYQLGLGWLAGVDAEGLNREVSAAGERLRPMEELPVGFMYGEYAASLGYHEGRLKRLKRLLTLNGYLLAARGDVTVSASSDIKGNYYRARRALNYDEASGKGFVAERSRREAWRIWRRLRKALRRLGRSFGKTVKQYRSEYGSYVTQEFWIKYLGL